MTVTAKPGRFVVVGSCIADSCVHVDRLPEIGETVLASRLTRALGGKGANQAVALRRLGGDVVLLSAVGDDEPGRSFLALLAAEGMTSDLVHRDPSEPTGMAMPLILPGGRNAIVAATGASGRLPDSAVEAATTALRAADAVLLQLEVPLTVVGRAMAIAREAGRLVVLNPAPVVPGAVALLAAADILIPNQQEAAALTTGPVTTLAEAAEAARKLRALGPRTVVVTMGELGAWVSAPGIERAVEPYPVAAIDPTGAGDAFCAGLVAAVVGGADWAEATDLGCACGALACRGEGAIPWLPAAAEVAALRRQGRP